jgi:hypothetical protein
LSDLCKQFATVSSRVLLTTHVPVLDTAESLLRLSYFGQKSVGIGENRERTGQGWSPHMKSDEELTVL